MFRNIKQLSEYSLLSERLTYVIDASRNKEKESSETTETVHVTAEDLAKSKEEMNNVLAAIFRDRSAEIYRFIRDHKAESYKQGDWQQWNKDFLKALNIPVDSNDVMMGVVRRFEEYISRQIDFPIKVDGKIGPEILINLRGYMARAYPENEVPSPIPVNEPAKTQPATPQTNPPKPETPKPTTPVTPGLVAENKKEGQVGWIDGVTKNYFFLRDENTAAGPGETDLQGEVFYVLNDDKTWVDYFHNPINLEEILPKLAGTEPLNGYYKVTDGGGALRYVDRQGKMYERMPIETGTDQWAIV